MAKRSPTAFSQLFCSTWQQPADTSGLCAASSETAELREMREEARTDQTGCVCALTTIGTDGISAVRALLCPGLQEEHSQPCRELPFPQHTHGVIHTQVQSLGMISPPSPLTCTHDDLVYHHLGGGWCPERVLLPFPPL